jgi:hypothetical protein
VSRRCERKCHHACAYCRQSEWWRKKIGSLHLCGHPTLQATLPCHTLHCDTLARGATIHRFPFGHMLCHCQVYGPDAQVQCTDSAPDAEVRSECPPTPPRCRAATTVLKVSGSSHGRSIRLMGFEVGVCGRHRAIQERYFGGSTMSDCLPIPPS